MNTKTLLTSLAALMCAAVVNAEQKIIQIPLSSSATLNSTDCCTMSYMGYTNPATISMRNCQSVYMSCVTSRAAAVWQFDLAQIPKDATLVSARFKGTRPEVYMTGSGYLRMRFDTGPLTSSVCLSMWNSGAWQTSFYWPYGNDFNFSVTSGMNQAFGSASTVSILGYASTTSSVVVQNTGANAPVLEVIVNVPDTLPCTGDVNGDGIVNGIDISLILGYWGRDVPEYDLDGSGAIGGADLATILGWWGPCPS